MKQTLESHKAFPYIAWGTIILFALFVFNMAVNLQDDLTQLNNSVTRMEASLEEMKDSQVQ